MTILSKIGMSNDVAVRLLQFYKTLSPVTNIPIYKYALQKDIKYNGSYDLSTPVKELVEEEMSIMEQQTDVVYKDKDKLITKFSFYGLEQDIQVNSLSQNHVLNFNVSYTEPIYNKLSDTTIPPSLHPLYEQHNPLLSLSKNTNNYIYLEEEDLYVDKSMYISNISQIYTAVKGGDEFLLASISAIASILVTQLECVRYSLYKDSRSY